MRSSRSACASVCSTTMAGWRGGCPGSTICTCRSRRPRCGTSASCPSRSRTRAIGRGCSTRNYDLARYFDGNLRVGVEIGRRARVERQGRRRFAQLQHAVRAADAHVRRPGRAARLLRAADPQLHRRERQPGHRGLSRLRRLAVRRRQQGRARFLGRAAQGHAQRLRQRRAQCVVSAVEAERRRSDGLADCCSTSAATARACSTTTQAGSQLRLGIAMRCSS